MNRSLLTPLFWIAALYDGVLGIVVFAILYSAIARDPERNCNLILYGILLKISYCGVVLFHWVTSELPFIWKPFFVADLIFLALFFWARKTLCTSGGSEEASG
jgi:hypothetical protein